MISIIIGNSTSMTPDGTQIILPPINATDTPHRCMDGMFMCLSGECIRQLYVCDSTQDCMDGSDERACNTGIETSGFCLFVCVSRMTGWSLLLSRWPICSLKLHV